MRLVMTPDRMVVDEARRTFTYLNLYGYLTDAVVVNRVFPEEVGDYFGAWRERQQEELREVAGRLRARARAARAVLRRGGRRARRCSTASATRSSTERDPGAVLHHARHAAARGRRRRRAGCASTCPSPTKGDISLKKIGLELDRPRRRPQAHADAAARAGRLPARPARRSTTAPCT